MYELTFGSTQANRCLASGTMQACNDNHDNYNFCKGKSH